MTDLLSKQFGVAAVDQLASAGLGRRQLERAVREGWLERRGPRLVVERGWSGGNAASDWTRELFSLVCSCPPGQRAGAAVFRRSAAILWGFDGISSRGTVMPTEVAVTTGRPVVGKIFRVQHIGEAERREVNGLPVTSPRKTLVDLGLVMCAGELERAVESALRKRLVSASGLLAFVNASPNRRGTHELRRLLNDRPPGQPPTESDAETLFVQLARRAGLPPPARQFVVSTARGKFRLDFAWPDIRVAVEIDGAATHASAGALGRDLDRQNLILLALSGAGWILLRFTWLDVVGEPGASRTAAKLLEAWSRRR